MADAEKFVDAGGGAVDDAGLVALLGSMREGAIMQVFRQGQIGKRGYVGTIPEGLGVDDLHQYVAETWGAGRYVLRVIGVDPRQHPTKRVFLPGAATIEIPDGWGRVANPQPAGGSTVPVQVFGPAAREPPLTNTLLQLLGGQTRSQETQTQILLRAFLEQHRGGAQPTGAEPLAKVIDALLSTRLQAEQPRDETAQLERLLGTFAKFQKMFQRDPEAAAPPESDLESTFLKAITSGMFGGGQQGPPGYPPPGYPPPPGYYYPPPPGYPGHPSPATWPGAGFQGPPAGPQAFQTTKPRAGGPADVRAAQGGPRAAAPPPPVSVDPRPAPVPNPHELDTGDDDDDEDLDLEPGDVAARIAEIAEADETAALDYFLEISARLPPSIQAAIGRKLEGAGLVPPSSQPSPGPERPALHLYTDSWSDPGQKAG